MKTRSITARNLAGGFLGGVSGIIGFGLIHPAVLPLGCVAGVLVGWWYQEILASAIKGWNSGTKIAEKMWQDAILFITTPTRKLKSININIEPELKRLHFIVFLIVWVFRSPIIFCRWLKKHPMNQAYVIRFLAMIAATEIVFLCMVPLGFTFNQALDQKNAFAEFLQLPALLAGIAALAMLCLYPLRKSETLRDFYSTWKQYAEKGVLRFFLWEIGSIILSQAAMAGILLGVISWFVAVGGLFVALIIAPLSFAIGIVKGVYQVTAKSGHWLCLITTLAVTLLSAWQTHDYFANAKILWCVALSTGVVAAVATEALRKLTASFCEQSEFIKKVALSELGAQLSPSGKTFMRVSGFMFDKCIAPLHFVLG